MFVLVKFISAAISHVVLRFSPEGYVLRLVLVHSVHQFKAVGVLDVLHLFAGADLEVGGFVLTVVLI